MGNLASCVSPKVISITPNRNLISPKVTKITFGEIEMRFYPHILTFLRQTTMYRAFEHVRDKGFSLTSP
jgi:hypothetical protein